MQLESTRYPISAPIVTPKGQVRTEAEDLPLLHIWQILRNHKFLLAGLFLAIFGLAALLSFSSVPVYQAKGVLELQIPASPSFSAREVEAAAPLNGQTFDAYLETQIGILESDTLIRRVVARMNLPERLSAFHPVGLAAVRWRLLGRHKQTFTADDAFDIAKANLKVRQSRLNNLIEILYNASDPKVAADFVNLLADEYAEQNRESRWQMADRNSKWLTHQMADLKTKLENSEEKMVAYLRGNGLLLLSGADSIAKDRLHQIQEQLSLAQSERIQRQAQMEMAARSVPDAVPQVLDNGSLKEYQSKLADLDRQLAEYRQLYTANNPKVKMLQAQIASLHGSYGKQQDSVLGRFRSEYEAASRNEKMLANRYAEQSRLVSEQEEKMIGYNTLKHDVDSNRTLYESLLQKVKESGISIALQTANITVVDAALPPKLPYKPNHLVNLGTGFLGGLLFSVLAVLVVNRADRKVRHAGATQRYVAVPELGVIPSGAAWKSDELSGSTAISTRSLTGRTEPAVMRAWLDPTSALSDSFRSVMTSLLFSGDNLSGVRFLVITSSGIGEGKTTVASNIAATLAASGRQVLLVDADIRRPRLHDIFGIRVGPGLLEYLDRYPGMGSSQLTRMAQSTEIPNLSVLASGAFTAADSSLFHTAHFAEAMAGLQAHFDTVIVDAPPLLYVPESRVLAHLADGVVLVIRAGTTRVESVVTAKQQMLQDGVNLVGTILNDAAVTTPSYYPWADTASAQEVRET